MRKTFLLTILFLGLGLVLGPAVSAAEVTVGGDLRLELSWGIQDKNYNKTGTLTDVSYFSLTTTRLKVRYNSEDNKFFGYFESAVKGWPDNGVTTRHAYFGYKWGGGQILFGQTNDIATPVAFLANQFLWEDNNLFNFGDNTYPRNEQITLTLGNKYQFHFSLLSPYGTSGPWAKGKIYHYLPAMVAAADLNVNGLRIHPFVQFENVRWTDGSKNDDYNIFDAGLSLKGDFGLVGFTTVVRYGFNSAVSLAKYNGAPLWLSYPSLGADGMTDKNATSYSLFGELRIERLSIGFARGGASRGDWSKSPYIQAGYVDYRIPFGKIEFCPEIAWFDFGKDNKGQSRGNFILVGLFTRMPF